MAQKFCMRCGKMGTRRADPAQEIWDCKDHGVIYMGQKAAPAETAGLDPLAVAGAPAAAPTPLGEAAGGPGEAGNRDQGSGISLKPGDPSAADLDAVAAEETIRVATGTPRRLH